MPTYTIVEGDHLSSIAANAGFRDYNTVWQHPNNADLRTQRPDPHVLFPGDVLFIPDKETKFEPAATAKLNPFVVPASRLKLRLVLKDFDGLPMPGLACEVHIAGATYSLTSNGDGLIETSIPPGAHEGILKVDDLDLEVPIKVGFLDPHEGESGWKARLINLGYLQKNPDQPLNETRWAHALEEFQCDHGLKLTGQPDDATKNKLKDLHGA